MACRFTGENARGNGRDHPDDRRKFSLAESDAGADRARPRGQRPSGDRCRLVLAARENLVIGQSLNSQTKVVVHRDCDLLLLGEVAFCRLDQE
jgi:hypothetical protein